jgi:hypothetical protein
MYKLLETGARETDHVVSAARQRINILKSLTIN